MRRTKFVACYAVVIVLALVVPATAQVFEVATIDVPNASATRPRSINPQGTSSGTYTVGATTHGFLAR